MKVRITQLLDEQDAFDLVAYADEDWFLEDYQDWLGDLDQEPTDANLYEFCREVVVEFINENESYNVGDNHGNLTAGLFNAVQDYREEVMERDASREASAGAG